MSEYDDHKNREEILRLLDRIPLDVVVGEFIAYVWRKPTREVAQEVYKAYTTIKKSIPRFEKEFGMKYFDRTKKFYRIF